MQDKITLTYFLNSYILREKSMFFKASLVFKISVICGNIYKINQL